MIAINRVYSTSVNFKLMPKYKSIPRGSSVGNSLHKTAETRKFKYRIANVDTEEEPEIINNQPKKVSINNMENKLKINVFL